MQLEERHDLGGGLELDELDRAVLWAIRSVAVGRGDCPSLRRTFLDLYGPPADQILCALLVLVRLVVARSPGGLRLHMPGSSAVSQDELLILAALAATQHEGLGEGGGQEQVRWADPCLALAFRHVARLLAGRGRRLTRPELGAVCEARAVAPARTLH